MKRGLQRKRSDNGIQLRDSKKSDRERLDEEEDRGVLVAGEPALLLVFFFRFRFFSWCNTAEEEVQHNFGVTGACSSFEQNGSFARSGVVVGDGVNAPFPVLFARVKAGLQ